MSKIKFTLFETGMIFLGVLALVLLIAKGIADDRQKEARLVKLRKDVDMAMKVQRCNPDVWALEFQLDYLKEELRGRGIDVH